MRATRIEHVGKLALAAAFLAFGSGCVTTTKSASGADTGLGATLSVERFLNAANARDHDAMMRLFGTADGPIANTGSSFGCAFKRMGSWINVSERCASREQIELRMDAIARIIRHQDYRIRSEERVAGRSEPTTMIGVDLDLGPRSISNVPFVCVRSGDGSWLIQEIGLQRFTG